MRPSQLRAHLNELFVFTVAARTGSFSEAARELGMTQSAVSHHVANLEAALGTRLFDRVWRGISLTEPGRELQQAGDRSFTQLAEAVAAVARRQNRRRITIHTDFAVAAQYLMPRLPVLRSAAREAEIRILTAQTPSAADLGPFDCGIVFGSAASFGRGAAQLVGEVVVPVANPALAARIDLAAVADPTSPPLLHLESDAGEWLDWAGYAELAGLPRPPPDTGLAFNNHQLLVEAAIGGEGVALGWRPLIDGLVAAGRLAMAGPAVRRRSWGYFLLQPMPLPADEGFVGLLETVRADFAAIPAERS